MRAPDGGPGPGPARHYLLRHGEAAPGIEDALRPLTPGGRRDVERVAARAAALGVRPVAVRHSGLLRARQTAEILAAHLTPPDGVAATPGLGPEDDPGVARALLESRPSPVVLVGHLPHLDRLVTALVADAGVRFAPATLVGLERDGAGWRVAWVVSPERSAAGPAGGAAPA